MKVKKILNIVLSGVLVLALAGCGAGQASEDDNVVKVGIVGENNDQWDVIIDKLAEEGITVELVTFTDYTQPNQALADKEIDLNAYQTYAFLEEEAKDRGYDFTPIGETIIAPLTLYSNKIKSVDELKDGDSIGIASDPANGGRALKILEAIGVIKVDESAGHTPTVGDITENPKNIEFVEVEAAQIPRLLDDVSAGFINGNHAVDAGLYPSEDGIYVEEAKKESNKQYINLIVARTEDKDNETYKKVAEIYQTDEVAEVINEVFKGAYLPAWQ